MLLRQVQLNVLWPRNTQEQQEQQQLQQGPECQLLSLNKTALQYMSKLDKLAADYEASLAVAPLSRAVRRQVEVLMWLHTHPRPQEPSGTLSEDSGQNGWFAWTNWLQQLAKFLEAERVGSWLSLSLAAHCSVSAIRCCGDLQARAFREMKWDAGAGASGDSARSVSLPSLLPALIRAMEIQLVIYKEAGKRFSEVIPILQVMKDWREVLIGDPGLFLKTPYLCCCFVHYVIPPSRPLPIRPHCLLRPEGGRFSPLLLRRWGRGSRMAPLTSCSWADGLHGERRRGL
jgi:hypothetical protein